MDEGGPVPAPVRAGDGAEPRLGSLLGAGVSAAALFAAPQFVPILAPLALVSPFPLVLQRLAGGAGGALLATMLAASLVGAMVAPAPAVVFLVVLAAPTLLLGESLARGRGLLRGCGWAFVLLVVETAVALTFFSGSMAEHLLSPLDYWTSEAFLKGLRSEGMSPESVTLLTQQLTELRRALAVVFPAVYVIGSAVLVMANAALLRLYLSRRDPGWLEDGEFERVRWPLGLVLTFVVSGAAVALPQARPVAYNVLLVTAFFFVLQGLAVVAFYVRRLAGPPLLKAVVALLVLANPWAPQILGLLGLFDNWFDFRKWAELPPEGR
jgi:uncharacterized protein YybS (DUF2232 family)